MIFVTGANGFIGRHLPFDHVKNTIDLTTNTPNLRGVDTVVHLAQSRHYKDGPGFYYDVWKVNADACFRLLDTSLRAGVRRFILATSGTTTGVYGASKTAAACIAEAFSSHMEVLALELYCVYGEGMRKDCLVSTLVDRVRSGEPISNGLITCPTYVADVGQAIEWACMSEATGRIAISGPAVMSVHEMASVIGQRFGIEPNLVQSAPDKLFRYSGFPCSTRFEDSPYIQALSP